MNDFCSGFLITCAAERCLSDTLHVSGHMIPDLLAILRPLRISDIRDSRYFFDFVQEMHWDTHTSASFSHLDVGLYGTVEIGATGYA